MPIQMYTVRKRKTCVHLYTKSFWYFVRHGMQYIPQDKTLQWRHNGRDSVSNHQPHDCLLHRLFRRRSTKASKLRVTGLSAGNSSETGEFPAKMAGDAEIVSIWWRHHDSALFCCSYILSPYWIHVIDSPIYFKLSSPASGQLYDCAGVKEDIRKNTGNIFSCQTTITTKWFV